MNTRIKKDPWHIDITTRNIYTTHAKMLAPIYTLRQSCAIPKTKQKTIMCHPRFKGKLRKRDYPTKTKKPSTANLVNIYILLNNQLSSVALAAFPTILHVKKCTFDRAYAPKILLVFTFT